MNEQKEKLKIGVRIHDIVRENDNLSEKIKATEAEIAQLTLPKFVSWSESPQNYSLEKLKALKTAFDEANVKISVLSCYINPLAVNTEKEQIVFKKFVDYCADLGIKIIGTETGTAVSNLNDYKINLTEGNYERAKNCLKPLIEYADKKGVTVGIESVAYYPICSSERLSRLESDVKPYRICSIFDATNLLTAENYTRQREIIDEFIKTHAQTIKIVHLKDFIIDNGFLSEAPLFSGGLDVEYVLKKLNEYNVKADIVVECSRSVEEFKNVKKRLIEMMNNV